MIIKNLSRKSGTGTLLHYLFKYIKNPEKVLEERPFIVRHNIKSRTIEGYIKEFIENEKNRKVKRKDQPSVYHVILSWSNLDSHLLDDKKLRHMAKEFIKLRGQLNQYIITKHLDQNHTHLHCAVSASQIDGKSSRMSKLQFSELKKSMDAFQLEHYKELNHSFPNHGKKMEQARESWRKMKHELEQLDAIRNRFVTAREKGLVSSRFIEL